MVEKRWLGLYRSNGYSLGKKKAGHAPQYINSAASCQRKGKADRLLKSRVYSAECFAHKIHYDQNKEHRMYGAVHVCARDVLSGMIVEFATMSMKNCLTIHSQIYQ